MPRQNRVTPFGGFEATAARGLLMGNRGILHDDQGTIGSARWRHKNWIVCVLSFKDRHRAIMAPSRYTELFFCDEATALAAGHRPCAECRRADFLRYMAAWQAAHGLPSPPRAGEVDEALHRARVTRDRQQVRISARLEDLPDGTLVHYPDEPTEAWLVWDGHQHRWSQFGYMEKRPRRACKVIVLTPEPTVRVLWAGYQPVVHPSATI